MRMSWPKITLLVFCCYLQTASQAQLRDNDVVHLTEEAQSLCEAGQFRQAYQLLEVELDTTILSPAAYFDFALCKLVAAREMRSRRRITRTIRDVAAARTQLADTLYRYPEYVYEMTYTQLRLNINEAEDWMQKIRNVAVQLDDPKYNAHLKYLEAEALTGPEGVSLKGGALRDAIQALTSVGEGNGLVVAKCLRTLGHAARNAADFEAAMNFYQQELAILRNLYTDSNFESAAANYNLANVYYETGQWQMALDHYLLTSTVWNVHYAPDATYLRFLNEGIGDMYWELELPDSALIYYEKSIIGEEGLDNDESEKMTQSGESSLRSGKYEEALSYYQAALKWRSENFGVGHPLTGACNNFVARVYMQKGETQAALDRYQQSIMSLSGLFADTAIAALPHLADFQRGSEQYAVEALSAKSDLLVSRFEEQSDSADLRYAFEAIDLAVNLIDRVRQNPIHDNSKHFWSNRAFPIYEKAITLSLRLSRELDDTRYLEKAFEFCEKSKAFILLDAMQNHYGESYAGIPARLIHKEASLRKELVEFNGRVLTEEKRCSDRRDKMLASWKSGLNTAQLNYDALLDTLHRMYPSYYQMKYDVEVTSLNYLKQVLPEGTAMLTCFEGDRTGVMFFIGNGKVRTHEYLIDSAYLEHARLLRHLLQTPGSEGWSEALQSFCNETVGAFIPEMISYRHVVVVPDGVLSYLPFEIFPLDEAGDERLVSRSSLSYAQSATVFLQARESNPTNATIAYAGFAPDYGSGHSEIRAVGALRYNIPEVQNASRHFGSSHVHIARAASKGTFERDATNAAVIHLAMHAIVDEESPLLSYLLFQTPTDTNNTGQMFAYELQTRRLHAQLAVLSACNTGVGKLQRGEGLMSMARSFQFAGCPAIVTTLWSVDDQASAELMDHFYEYLADGQPKHKALQMAKLALLKTADPATSHPFYWAGYTMIGNVDPLKLDSTNLWMVLFWGMLLLFAAIALLKLEP